MFSVNRAERAYSGGRIVIVSKRSAPDRTHPKFAIDERLVMPETRFEVVDGDRTVLSTRLALAQIDGQRLIASVALIKALGGGWRGAGWK